jgi:hypothetical protein
LVLFGLLPAIVAFVYFQVIPWLSVLSGYPYPWLAKYEKLVVLQGKKQFFVDLFTYRIPQLLIPNIKSVVLETLGIMRIDPKAAYGFKVSYYSALCAVSILIFYMVTAQKKYYRALFLLCVMALSHAILLVLIPGVWGPYYYGSYYSIFMVIYMALTLDSSSISKVFLVICVFLVSLNVYNTFLGTNLIVRKYHFYPCDPGVASLAFQGKKTRLDPAEKNEFSKSEIRAYIQTYANKVKDGISTKGESLPKELGWLALEMEPGKYQFKDWLSVYKKKFIVVQDVILPVEQ